MPMRRAAMALRQGVTAIRQSASGLMGSEAYDFKVSRPPRRPRGDVPTMQLPRPRLLSERSPPRAYDG